MGEIIAPKHVELVVIINKTLLLLHLVDCLYYYDEANSRFFRYFANAPKSVILNYHHQ